MPAWAYTAALESPVQPMGSHEQEERNVTDRSVVLAALTLCMIISVPLMADFYDNWDDGQYQEDPGEDLVNTTLQPA